MKDLIPGAGSSQHVFPHAKLKLETTVVRKNSSFPSAFGAADEQPGLCARVPLSISPEFCTFLLYALITYSQ